MALSTSKEYEEFKAFRKAKREQALSLLAQQPDDAWQAMDGHRLQQSRPKTQRRSARYRKVNSRFQGFACSSSHTTTIDVFSSPSSPSTDSDHADSDDQPVAKLKHVLTGPAAKRTYTNFLCQTPNQPHLLPVHQASNHAFPDNFNWDTKQVEQDSIDWSESSSEHSDVNDNQLCHSGFPVGGPTVSLSAVFSEHSTNCKSAQKSQGGFKPTRRSIASIRSTYTSATNNSLNVYKRGIDPLLTDRGFLERPASATSVVVDQCSPLSGCSEDDEIRKDYARGQACAHQPCRSAVLLDRCLLERPPLQDDRPLLDRPPLPQSVLLNMSSQQAGITRQFHATQCIIEDFSSSQEHSQRHSQQADAAEVSDKCGKDAQPLALSDRIGSHWIADVRQRPTTSASAEGDGCPPESATGSHWIKGLRGVSHDDQSKHAPHLSQPPSTSAMSASKREKSFVRNGLAERLQRLLLRQQSERVFLRHQVANGSASVVGGPWNLGKSSHQLGRRRKRPWHNIFKRTIATINESAITVEVLAGSLCSGVQWAHCCVLRGTLFEHSGDVTAVDSVEPNECEDSCLQMVVILVPAELRRRLQLTVGSQMVIYRPWHVLELSTFCLPVIVCIQMCEVAKPRLNVLISDGLRKKANLSSHGLCPSLSCSHSTKQAATAYESLKVQSFGDALAKESGPSLPSTSASSSRVTLDQYLCLRSSVVRQPSNQLLLPTAASILGAIEAAGGSAAAVHGQVHVFARVQRVRSYFCPGVGLDSQSQTSSLLQSCRLHLLQNNSDQTKKKKWLLFLQDSHGVCFAVHISCRVLDENGIDELSSAEGQVWSLRNIRLVSRVQTSRSPELYSMVESLWPPKIVNNESFGCSQESDGSWCDRHPSMCIYSLETLDGLSELGTTSDYQAQMCGYSPCHTTCHPTQTLREETIFVRWTTCAKVLLCYPGSSCSERNVKGCYLLVAILWPPLKSAANNSLLSYKCLAETDGVCPGLTQCAASSLQKMMSSSCSALTSCLLCVFVQSCCILDEILLAGAADDAIVHMQDLLVPSHLSDCTQKRNQSSSLHSAEADMFTAIKLITQPKMQHLQSESNHLHSPELVQALQGCHCPCQPSPLISPATPFTVVVLSGTVCGLDESTAIMWFSCSACGADVDQTPDGMVADLYCSTCGQLIEEPAHHFQLDIFLKMANLEDAVVLVRLQQETTVSLLPPTSSSQSPDAGYDFALVHGKLVSSLVCLITSVQLSVDGTCRISAVELPKNTFH